MKFKYAEKENYEELSAGHVLYGHPGNANFPVRLGTEIFNRCLELSEMKNGICLYDPCCGGGYLLTTVALTNGNVIAKVVGSDVNAECLETTRKNLSLLSESGLAIRKKELEYLFSTYQKKSHQTALESLDKVLGRLRRIDAKISVELFQADILVEDFSTKGELSPDIVLIDVPYGNLVSWTSDVDPIQRLLKTVSTIRSENLVVGVISNSEVKGELSGLVRKERFKIGKRHVSILKRS